MRHARVLLAALVVAAALAPAGAAAAPAVDESSVHASHGSCAFPVTETDATGTQVQIAEEPQRVVTLAPSAAQTMWEIGAREKVVGVTTYAGYLEGADEKANVTGSGGDVSVEAVVGLEPDLVLAPNVASDETVAKLRETGLTVYKFEEAKSLEAVEAKTALTGRLVGACDGADRAVSAMERNLSRVDRAVAGRERPRVMYVFFGYVAGDGTFVDAVIEAAGGTNAAAEAGIEGWGEVSPEVVVQQDPQWFVLNEDDPQVPETQAYNGTTAVQKDQVVVVDRNLISQPAPRIVRIVVRLARTFHPGTYEAAGESATATTTATPMGSPTPTVSPTPAHTDQDGPGFGVAAALLALLAAGLFARR